MYWCANHTFRFWCFGGKFVSCVPTGRCTAHLPCLCRLVLNTPQKHCYSHRLQTKQDSVGETSWGRCAGVPVISCLFSSLFHRNLAMFCTHDVDPRHPWLEQQLAPYSRMFHPWAKQGFIALPGTVSSV